MFYPFHYELFSITTNRGWQSLTSDRLNGARPSALPDQRGRAIRPIPVAAR